MNENSQNNYEFKLGDFGLSCTYKGKECEHWTLCGTPNYICPTILIGHVMRRLAQQKSMDNNLSQQAVQKCQQLVEAIPTLNQPQDYEVDMWSFGVLLYQLVTKKCPFEGKTITETYQNIIDLNVNYRPLEQYPSLLDLVQKCLQLQPNKRITTEQALDHMFLRSIQLKEFPGRLYKTTYNQFFSDQNNKDKYLNIKEASNWDEFAKLNQNIFSNKLYNIAQLLIQEQSETFKYQKVKMEIQHPILDSCLIEQLLQKFKIQLETELKQDELIDYLSIYKTNPELNSQIPIYTLSCQLYQLKIKQQIDVPIIIPQRYLYSWIDQSGKFGFSCMTNDGWYSIKFNDNQIVVISSNQILCIVVDNNKFQLLLFQNLPYVLKETKIQLIKKVLKKMKMPDSALIKDTMDLHIVKFLPILYDPNCYRSINSDSQFEQQQKQLENLRNNILTNVRQGNNFVNDNFEYIVTFSHKNSIDEKNVDLVIQFFKKRISQLCGITPEYYNLLNQMDQTIRYGIYKILCNYNLIRSYDTKEIDRYKFEFENYIQYNYTDHSKYAIGNKDHREVVLVNEYRLYCIMTYSEWEKVKKNNTQIRERLSYEDKNRM